MPFIELLKNGDATHHDFSGWELTNGGNGWQIDRDGYNGNNDL